MELYNVQRFNRQALHTPPRSEDEVHIRSLPYLVSGFSLGYFVDSFLVMDEFVLELFL